MRALIFLPLLLGLAACGRNGDGAVEVAVIGEPDALFDPGTRLALPGETVRAATSQGLVRLDEAGQLVPGVADRWIVTEDGESYIFKIREVDLPGGQRIDARTVQRELSRTIAGLRGTSLGLDLAHIRDVRAMAGRVIEIRLKSPMPGFLQLLAQPELGIAIRGTPTGPMALRRAGQSEAVLTALPPEARGLPAQPGWAEETRLVRVTAANARAVTQAFADGRYNLVLGGTLASLPLVDVGPLSRGTVRIDPALGLFGLDVLHTRGFLADTANREALALALDRPELIAPFNLAGWVPTTRIVAPGLADDPGIAGERWQGMELTDRRALAAGRVARWRAANGGATPLLSVNIPEGPGADTLFDGLAAQYRAIGIVLARADTPRDADLALRDRTARYAAAGWFLNQFNCRVSAAICSPEVDALVAEAVNARDPAAQANLLANAENALAAYNAFIPIGAPIRWSLVRSGVVGFAENAWAIHPLFPLSRAPI